MTLLIDNSETCLGGRKETNFQNQQILMDLARVAYYPSILPL
jgi:hypothetical protein